MSISELYMLQHKIWLYKRKKIKDMKLQKQLSRAAFVVREINNG